MEANANIIAALERLEAVMAAHLASTAQKICCGIGPNQITAENRDVAIFFSLLVVTAPRPAA
jgi:hypothetical protein